jgi:hypothetical protein
MKKLFLYCYILLLLLTILSITQCRKTSERLNVNLFDKPTGTIENYIQGKWRLHYMFGGICGCPLDRTQFGEYYEFLPGRRLIYTFQGSVEFDTYYTWTTYQFNPSDYVHKLLTYETYYSFEVEKIVNDTLVLVEPSLNNPDNLYYYLTKAN